MLCPDCELSAPGGSPCPRCGQPVPERESFEGQGDRYLRILTGVALSFLILLILIARPDLSLGERLIFLWRSGRLWIYLVICVAPLGTGLYYWALLREEEITVTDAFIARRSHWGDECLHWADVRAFRRQSIPLHATQLGRIAFLGRLFRDNERLWDRMPFVYELVGASDQPGFERSMRLEPGTIDAMPWLLQLIEEHVGPAVVR
jgi:hypothetical protein